MNFELTSDIIAILGVDTVLSLLKGFDIITHSDFLRAKILIAGVLIVITVFGE